MIDPISLSSMGDELTKLSVSANWIREMVAGHAAKKKIFKSGRDPLQREIASKAVGYVGGRKAGGEAAKKGREGLRNVIKKVRAAPAGSGKPPRRSWGFKTEKPPGGWTDAQRAAHQKDVRDNARRAAKNKAHARQAAREREAYKSQQKQYDREAARKARERANKAESRAYRAEDWARGAEERARAAQQNRARDREYYQAQAQAKARVTRQRLSRADARTLEAQRKARRRGVHAALGGMGTVAGGALAVDQAGRANAAEVESAKLKRKIRQMNSKRV